MLSDFGAWKPSLAIGILMMSFVITSCATYQKGIEKTLAAVDKKDYVAAIAATKKSLKPTGKNRLLYYLELGLLKHLNGQFDASNVDLEQAATIAENLETKRIGGEIAIALTSPRDGDYRGTKFERTFIHYYKTLNYIFLGLNDPSQSEKMREAARIESRKVDIVLTALQNEKSTYDEMSNGKKSLFNQLIKIFAELSGNSLDADFLVYREDAYLRYMTGVVYESNGEYNEARVAYQQAAELYEKGFAKQYLLDTAITEQAWFDVIRMMQWTGDYESEWSTLAKKKLSPTRRQQLASYQRGAAQLLVIEHLGMIPRRDELNLHLTLDMPNKTLVIKPILTGTMAVRKGQVAWFNSMYADKGLLWVINNYQNSSAAALSHVNDKRINISFAWETLQKMGLPQAIGGIGARVTVPYYHPPNVIFGRTELWVNGKHQNSLVSTASLAQLALQEQLLNAGTNLQEALGREFLRSIAVRKILGGGDVGSMIGGVLNRVLSQAETRNWLTLPYEIRMTRLPVTAGHYRLKLVTRNKTNSQIIRQSDYEIDVSKGQLYVLRDRKTSRSHSASSPPLLKNADVKRWHLPRQSLVSLSNVQ